MKSKISFELISISVLFIGVILFSSCANSTEPGNNQNLFIESGFFTKINSEEADKFSYVIELEYYVKNESCNIGGYGIRYDSSHSAQMDWYKMLTINPDQIYLISDTINVNFEILTNPIVRMQGYKIGSSESVGELSVEYALKQK